MHRQCVKTCLRCTSLLSSLKGGCLHELSWPAFPPGSAYALFLALCLCEKASWPDSSDPDCSSRNPSTLASLLSHINTMTVFKANKASRDSRPAWIASYKEALKLPIKGLEIPGGWGHSLTWPKRVFAAEQGIVWRVRFLYWIGSGFESLAGTPLPKVPVSAPPPPPFLSGSKYTRTVIERRFKWLARYVRYNIVLLYRCSFPYILLQLSWSI